MTTVTGGTLQIGAGSTAGALGSGNVINNGALAFNRSDAITVANVISGTGAVNKLGNGTTTLTGANTYGGATDVAAGTLAAGLANTFSSASQHRVQLGATLDMNGFNQTIAGLNNSGTTRLSSADPSSGSTPACH